MSLFIEEKFKGHQNYVKLCCCQSQLIAALKLLNQEFSPHLLFGGAADQVEAPVEKQEE